MKRKYADKDFVITMLPVTRRKQFFDLLKTRWTVLLKVFLVSFLFAFPILVSYSIKYFFIIANAAVELDVTSEQYLAFFKLTNIIFYIVDVVTYAIFAIGYSGIVNVFKKMAWAEPIFFWKDFFRGIKQNWLYFLVGTIIISIVRFAINSFGILSDYHFLFYILNFFYFMILPAFFIGLAMSSIYKVKIIECFSKAAVFSFRKFGSVLLFLLYILFVILSKYYLEEFFGMALLGFYLKLLNIIIVFPLFCLMGYLFSLSMFDEYTNKNLFKEYYHRGLFDSVLYKKKPNRKTFLLK